MGNDDASTALDRDDFDADDPEIFGIDGGAGTPPERVDDPDADPDDALLEAELGEGDMTFADDSDDDLEDEPDDLDDDDDDREIVLLQELGIDLDARDEPSVVVESFAFDDDSDSGDEEVAA